MVKHFLQIDIPRFEITIQVLWNVFFSIKPVLQLVAIMFTIFLYY